MSSTPPAPTDPCPCGTARPYGACCGPYLAGEPAPTAEATMRSRYTAYAVGDVGHLVRTWHPRTRPTDLRIPTLEWVGLRVLGTEAGGPDDASGTVEFEARHLVLGGTEVLHEVSDFVRRGGRWVYVDARA
ncbi:YchJ family protein [Lapillicoccus jejuensis]|uniref:UPF0225 protein FB458_3001 n=1 Tax=Lapillicoccus jejuensis TaxID=402171 RepID=A0A542E3I0_9MICO|nr:YchJ family metal-binding protein [Lapillicoccus jejuensis]TQJ09885.1 SEC-C motif-containing protein [Lapillicoccus jejuensis]